MNPSIANRTRWILVAVAVATPFITALVVVLSKGRWYPAGDMAQAELHMRGFFGNPPLVGAAGRIIDDTGFQGSHPGPSLWFAMLPVYVIGGRSSAALMAAVVSVHLVSTAVAMWLARRRFGWSGVMVVSLLVLLFARSSGPDFVVEPWNPWLALIPFLVFVLLADEVINRHGSWRWTAGAVVVGSHCVQCHAGYALVVGVAFVLMLLALVRRRDFRGVGGGLAALGVVWVLPFVDQIRREPGNIEILWQHFASPDEPTIPLGEAVRIMATQFNVIGPWLTGSGVAQPAETWARWPGFAAFVVLVGLARRRASKTGDREIGALLLTLIGGIVVAGLSILRIFGSYLDYTIRWVWILSGLAVLVSVLALARSTRARTFRRLPGRTAWAGVVVAVAVLAGVSVGADAKMPGAVDSDVVEAIVPQLEPLIGDDTILVHLWDPYTLDATGFGTVLELERRGYSMRVDPSYAAAALPHRTATVDEVDQVWWFVVGPVDESSLNAPGVARIAHVDPRTPADEIEAIRLLAEIERRLVETGREDLVAQENPAGAAVLFAFPPIEPDIVELLTEYYRLGQPVSVLVLPEGIDPDSLR